MTAEPTQRPAQVPIGGVSSTRADQSRGDGSSLSPTTALATGPRKSKGPFDFRFPVPPSTIGNGTTSTRDQLLAVAEWCAALHTVSGVMAGGCAAAKAEVESKKWSAAEALSASIECLDRLRTDLVNGASKLESAADLIDKKVIPQLATAIEGLRTDKEKQQDSTLRNQYQDRIHALENQVDGFAVAMKRLNSMAEQIRSANKLLGSERILLEQDVKLARTTGSLSTALDELPGFVAQSLATSIGSSTGVVEACRSTKF